MLAATRVALRSTTTLLVGRPQNYATRVSSADQLALLIAQTGPCIRASMCVGRETVPKAHLAALV